MNKKELIKTIATKTGFSQKDVSEVIDNTLDAIIDSLYEGEEVNIAGFGKFTVQERAAREARNPRTGEVLHVDATRVPKFKAGKAFKETVVNK